MERKFKRVVVISDLHCGHRVGLTPPQWQYQDNPLNELWVKYAAIQREVWNFYQETMRKLQPIDCLIANGDLIDGKGLRSGGTENIDENRISQIDMAAFAIREARAKTIVITRGTGYHTGSDEDWEDLVARDLDAKIGDHEFVDVNGLIFDLKHHCGSSQIPHGRHTAVSREALWNSIWAEHEEQPKGNVVIRSHVHYHAFCGQPGYLAMTTPALQGFGSKYGARRCSGTVDIGLVYFDVTSKTDYSWDSVLAKLPSMKAKLQVI